MVTDTFKTKKGADSWAAYSRRAGYKVNQWKTKKGYRVSRTRRKHK